MIGNTAFWSGDLAQARTKLEIAVELAVRDAADPPLLSAYGQDPEVTNRGILSWALCFQGRFEDARAQAARAVERAEALEHPFTMAFACGASMWVHAYQRHAEGAKQWAERTLELSRRRGFTYFETAAAIAHGWACAALGDARAGVREIERALERWRATGQTIGLQLFQLMLADACLLGERVDEARAALADPILNNRGSAEGWIEPLLHCLRAEASLAARAPDAEDVLREALAFARERGAQLIVDRLSARRQASAL